MRTEDAVDLALDDRIASPPPMGKRRTWRALLLTFDTKATPLTTQLGGFGLDGHGGAVLVKRTSRYSSETKV